MNIERTKIVILARAARAVVVVIAWLAVLVLAGGVAHAAEAPVKEVLSSHVGWEVDATTKGNVCTIASGNVCRQGRESTEPGGFASAASAAVQTDPASPTRGDVYVADRNNDRVQELKPDGEFVLMFGMEVNETTKGDICTEEEVKISAVKCKGGVEGTLAGAFARPTSVTVDPSTGDLYVQDYGNWRVAEYTAEGEFMLIIGRDVNRKGGNLCTKAEAGECQAGKQSSPGSTESGAFSFIIKHGDVLAVGGPEDLLYVGDQQRVQEFRADGSSAGEIALPSGGLVAALAVNASGDVYLAYEGGASVLELGPNGQQLTELPVAPREPETYVEIDTLALDPAGHLAVNALEEFPGFSKWFGTLYDVNTGQLLSEYADAGPEGLGFESNGDMYAAASVNTVSGTGNEVLVYEPRPIAELTTSAVSCAAGVDNETDATLNCPLSGDANPWNVPATEAWFQWGLTNALGENTPRQAVGDGETPVPVTPAVLEGLPPNTRIYYRLVAYDHSVEPPEEAIVSRPTASFTTATAPPRIVGEPSASFVKSSIAVLAGEVNPENATTEYYFEYGQCQGIYEICTTSSLEACATSPYTARTAPVASDAYGPIGTASEITGLRSCTSYHYRLVATNEKAQSASQQSTGEGVFTTAPAPAVNAETGPASSVTSTSAIVSGTLYPGGQPATYAFELGVYQGASTQYGVVSSGPAGSAATQRQLLLTGLQPGTTYAYRIAISSGYVENETHTLHGATMMFTTAAVPTSLSEALVLPQLALPKITFPKEEAKGKSKKPTRAEQLARALKACAKQPKGKRAACKQAARKKYGPVKTTSKNNVHKPKT